MPLINELAQVIEDAWSYPGQRGDAKALGSTAVLPLEALVAEGSEKPLDRPLGVYAPAGTTADLIVPHLNRLDLVVVEFPKFRDGRGFTVARTLREKHGFKGDIRAIGHVLPDQFAALVQCGFSSIVLPSDHPAGQWAKNIPTVTRSAGGPLLQRLLSAQAVAAAKPEAT